MFFVHGAGRTGKDAWPDQPAEGTVYADHGQATTMAAKAAAVGKPAALSPSSLTHWEPWLRQWPSGTTGCRQLTSSWRSQLCTTWLGDMKLSRRTSNP